MLYLAPYLGGCRRISQMFWSPRWVVTTMTESPTLMRFWPPGVRIVPFRLMQQSRRLSFRSSSLRGISVTAEGSRMKNTRGKALTSKMI